VHCLAQRHGKSTLMKCVAGLVRPTRGSVSLTIDGWRTDLARLSAEAICRSLVGPGNLKSPAR